MTEAEWLAATDPNQMLEILRGKACDRKLRLLACACCRRAWDLLTREASRRAVEVAEGYADGRASEVKRREAFRSALAADREVFEDATGHGAESWDTDETDAAGAVVQTVVTNHQLRLRGGLAGWDKVLYLGRYCPGKKLWQERHPEEDLAPRLLHDIFGNPFRPVTIDPSWRTSTVVALAQQMYDSRDLSPMPILADALEDAGCDHPDVLDHCRGAGPHVRGCWVVDLILDRA